MDCQAKDGLIIFLLILSGVLTAIVTGALIFLCRKKCCGAKKKKEKVENFEEVEQNISTVSHAINYQEEAQAEGWIAGEGEKEVESGPIIADDHIYQSAYEESDTEYGSIISSKSRQPSLVSAEPHVELVEKLSKMSSSSSSSSSSPSLSSMRGTAKTPEPVYAEPQKVRHVQAVSVQQPRTSSSSSSSSSSRSSLADEDLSLTRVVELEDMEVVEEREEAVVPRVSYHSEEEQMKPRGVVFYHEEPPKLHEDGSIPSRMAYYQSEHERGSYGSSSESGEDDVIIAEHTGTGESIDQALAALEEPEVVVQTVQEDKVSWVDLGTDVDWARRTVEQMEKEIKMAEQKYSGSDSTSSDSTMQVEEEVVNEGGQLEKGRNLNRFSFDLSSPSLDEEMADVELEVHQTVTLVESPAMGRRSSSSSSKSSISSSSSSSSNSPSKTIAEVDLSLPLSQQIVSELQSGDFRFSANYFSHITGQLPTNNSYIYEIEEEGSGTEYSSEEAEEVDEGLRVVGSPLIKQAMPVTYHSDSHSPSSSSPCSSPEPPLTPMPHPVASLNPTPVLADDPSRPRFLSDIAEGSEPVNRSSASSSSTEDSTVIRGDPNLDRLKGEGLRRNSSGITSASTSIMRMRLSTDYESVYSKVEEAKKKSREESYKNVKLNLQSHDDSAA